MGSGRRLNLAYFHNMHNWSSYGVPRSLLEALRWRGHEVTAFRTGRFLAKRAKASPRSPDLLKPTLVGSTFTEASRPDAILFASSGLAFPEDEMARLRKWGAVLVGFGFSDPRWYETKVRPIIPSFDLFFTLCPEVHDAWQHASVDVRRMLPSIHDGFHKRTTSWDMRHGIMFVGLGKGHPDHSSRLETLRSLRKAGIPVTVYGRRWDALPDSQRGPAHGGELIKALNAHRVGLDLGAAGAISRRVFEYAACGALVVLPEGNRLAKDVWTDPGVSYLAYRGSDHLVAILRGVETGEIPARNVAERGYREVHARHRISDRAEAVEQALLAHIPARSP